MVFTISTLWMWASSIKMPADPASCFSSGGNKERQDAGTDSTGAYLTSLPTESTTKQTEYPKNCKQTQTETHSQAIAGVIILN